MAGISKRWQKTPQQNYRKTEVEKEENISYKVDVTDQRLFCSSRRIPVHLFSLSENTSETTQADIGSWRLWKYFFLLYLIFLISTSFNHIEKDFANFKFKSRERILRSRIKTVLSREAKSGKHIAVLSDKEGMKGEKERRWKIF